MNIRASLVIKLTAYFELRKSKRQCGNTVAIHAIIKDGLWRKSLNNIPSENPILKHWKYWGTEHLFCELWVLFANYSKVSLKTRLHWRGTHHSSNHGGHAQLSLINDRPECSARKCIDDGWVHDPFSFAQAIHDTDRWLITYYLAFHPILRNQSAADIFRPIFARPTYPRGWVVGDDAICPCLGFFIFDRALISDWT